MLLTFGWCLHSAEIDKVMEMLHHFGAYNRAVAQGGAQSARQGGGGEIGLQRLGEDKHWTGEQDTKALGLGLGLGQDLEQAAPKHSPDAGDAGDAGDAAEAKRASIPSAVLSEFVASMLEQEQEPRLKKVLIMSQVQGWDRGDNPVLLLALVCPVLLSGTLVATPFSLVGSMSTCLQSYWTAVPTRILVQLRMPC
jgi:hypothetical protein